VSWRGGQNRENAPVSYPDCEKLTRIVGGRVEYP
jgi:hypothetical protein